MKKILAAVAAVLLLSIQGCNPIVPDNDTSTQPDSMLTTGSGTEEPPTQSGAQEIYVADLFPIKNNLTLIYDGQGSEYAPLTVYTDYTDGNRLQRRVDNGATVVLEVLEVKDGRLTKLVSRPEAYYRENLIPSAPDEGEILLAEPIETGNSWTLSDGRVRTITDTAAKVTTPSGSYIAVEVTTQYADSVSRDYYAPGTGLVRTVFAPGEDEVSSSLKTIEQDGTFSQRAALFYPSAEDGEIYYVTKELSFRTNDVTRLKIAEIYRTVPDSGFARVFSSDTSINSLYLNKDGMVYVDLSQSFIDGMNAGAELEQKILQCVADTAGTYYGEERVILTVDGQPYSSGHIKMKAGEYLTVSENTRQWER